MTPQIGVFECHFPWWPFRAGARNFFPEDQGSGFPVLRTQAIGTPTGRGSYHSSDNALLSETINSGPTPGRDVMRRAWLLSQGARVVALMGLSAAV